MSAVTTGDYRFVTLWDKPWEDNNYAIRTKFTFLLHKPVCLYKGTWEYIYTIGSEGDLIIYKAKDWYSKPTPIEGFQFAKDHPMVVELSKYLLNEVIENEVLSDKNS